MTTGIEQKAHIEAIRGWLDENRTEYKRALSVLNDPAQVRGFVKSIAAKVSGALRYDPYNHPAVAAVAEIAKLSERLVGVLSDIEFLDEFEDNQKRYTDAVRAYVKLESSDEPDSPEPLEAIG